MQEACQNHVNKHVGYWAWALGNLGVGRKLEKELF